MCVLESFLVYRSLRHSCLVSPFVTQLNFSSDVEAAKDSTIRMNGN